MENSALTMPPRNPMGINGTLQAHHVCLRTTDIDASIDWYTDKLGFRLIKRFAAGELKLAFIAPANDDHFWIELISGGSTSPAPATEPPIETGFQHLSFTVANVDATLAELRERGVQTMREPFDVPVIGKRCGFTADLFGNVLEFMQNLS